MEHIKDNDIIILRCCRDWPVHVDHAIGWNGKCGLCRQVPKIVWELYPEEKFARNQGSGCNID